MLRVLRMVMRGLAMFAGALLEDGAGMFGWMARTIYEGVTRRSLAAEAAEAAEAQARVVAARDAEEQAQADRVDAAARHEEAAALAERHLAETRALKEELARLARRRDEIRDLSRPHDPEIRSSTWRHVDEPEPEPESGAPALAYA